MKANLLRALKLIAQHPGTRCRAFLGWSYHFNMPGFKRAPFRAATVDKLIERKLVEASVEGKVQISELGKSFLNSVYPVDRLGRRKRMGKNWC